MARYEQHLSPFQNLNLSAPHAHHPLLLRQFNRLQYGSGWDHKVLPTVTQPS
jgi:hypothetical protein